MGKKDLKIFLEKTGWKEANEKGDHPESVEKVSC
jgi:predicted RNA binding protein YcfA (HicA-like mRNA interferase family)